MAKKQLISGMTTINGAKYVIIRRVNIIITLILGLVVFIIGALKLSTFLGAFLFGAGLTAFLLSLEQLGNAIQGYTKRIG